jgi:hypothetical protein
VIYQQEFTVKIHPIVELTEAVTRGGLSYSAGHHFELMTLRPKTAECRSSTGRLVRLPRRILQVVIKPVVRTTSKPVVRTTPSTPKDKQKIVAELIGRDVVRPASTLVTGGAA